MRLAPVLWGLVAVLVGALCVDFLHRVMSPDLVAVAFSEGGDDAYYFFTVARNIAQGHGITIDGTHWTTGFQPLWGLICAAPFLAPSDRAAFAIIYVLSLLLWLASAALLVRLVRRASTTPMQPLATALIVVLFLGETQFVRGYFNGMETGLYLTLTLGLLAAFQDYLGLPPGQVSLRRVAGLGVLAGLTMLARNDAFLLCGALLAVALFGGKRRQPVRDGAIIVAIASAMVLPWLIYCQWAWGNPMPQSGIATSVAVRGYVPLESILRKIVASIAPLGFFKVRSVVDEHLAIAIAATLAAIAGWIVYWRRSEAAFVTPISRRVLLAFGAANACLLLYYPLASSAGQFFERYFVPLKLLVFVLLAILIVRLWAAAGRGFVASALVLVLAAGTVAPNVYWVARDYSRPWRSHLGPEAYDIVRSRYATGNSRIGMFESGRLGFLYPTRVVNLDGKMSVEALRAVLSGTLDRYLQSANLDYVMLHDEDVEYFDQTIPAWRKSRRKAPDMIGEFVVFEKIP
jgi:hypothetical protein